MTNQANTTAGTKIWKRVDGLWTGVKSQVPGRSYLEQFPGATEFEKRLSDERQPGGIWIADGNISDDDGSGLFKVERFHPPSVSKDAIVVEATSKPPFGEWVELDKWPAEND